jgi:uncharacterized membrane protein
MNVEILIQTTVEESHVQPTLSATDPPATAPLDSIKRLIVMLVVTVLFLSVTRSLQLQLPQLQPPQQQPLPQLLIVGAVIWFAMVTPAVE